MASSILAGWRPMRCSWAIDPYPRKPDAVFEPPVVAADPEDHPFAALKALQPGAKPRGPKKPKGRLKGGCGVPRRHAATSADPGPMR